ncbi:SDR family oxidoreductase [Micromonospora wenchangensis]|uniref:SDR family oxidoreductase n=1 Tax=Micromonospora wenchangensis TaxID=1185415 RepID=UPI0037F79417
MGVGGCALVTGANKGIGYAVARALGGLGMCVYLGARDERRGLAAARSLGDDGLDVRFLRLDVTDESGVRLAAKRLDDEVGRLDVLVNNAGVGGGMSPPSATATDQVRQVYETNVFGVVTVTNAMLPLLRRSTAGRIVNVSSVIGSLTHAAAKDDPTGVFPMGVFPTLLEYATSKAALNALTVTYANELRGSGILVNAVSPGFVATDINGNRGTLTPAQGARLVVRMATLGADGPTGVFVGENGTPDGQPLCW